MNCVDFFCCSAPLRQNTLILMQENRCFLNATTFKQTHMMTPKLHPLKRISYKWECICASTKYSSVVVLDVINTTYESNKYVVKIEIFAFITLMMLFSTIITRQYNTAALLISMTKIHFTFYKWLQSTACGYTYMYYSFFKVFFFACIKRSWHSATTTATTVEHQFTFNEFHIYSKNYLERATKRQ